MIVKHLIIKKNNIFIKSSFHLAKSAKVEAFLIKKIFSMSFLILCRNLQF
jgi:hypothetical protein